MLEALQARRKLEANSALAPFAELGEHIFSDEGNLGGPANELALLGVGLRRAQCQVRSAVRRGDGYPAAARLIARVKDQLETELIDVEAQAAVQIAHEDRDGLEAQVRVLAIQANRGPVCPFARSAAHAQHYI